MAPTTPSSPERIIRGDTPRFDYVAAECSKGVASVTAATGVPVVFGVLTTDTVDQALNNAGLKHGNKGFDAAVTAIEMANVLRACERDRPPRFQAGQGLQVQRSPCRSRIRDRAVLRLRAEALRGRRASGDHRSRARRRRTCSAADVAQLRTERDAVDAVVDARLHNWSIGRLAVLDHTVLRLGCYELLYRADTPPKVAINEYIELAKIYGSEQKTAKLVNGVLDKIARDHRGDEVAKRGSRNELFKPRSGGILTAAWTPRTPR